MRAFSFLIIVVLLALSFYGGTMYQEKRMNAVGRNGTAMFSEQTGVTVLAVNPVRRDMFETIRATGNLEAVNRMEVFSQVPGVIKKCLVKEGQTVKKKQIMAKLDDRELKLNNRQAYAALRQARVNEDNLKETLERNEELYDDQLISDQQIEQLRAQYQMARAQVKSARVAKDLARLNLSYATIKSPMGGTVATRNCELNQRVTTADTIFEVAELGKLRIRIFVTEEEVHRINTGARPVRMKFDALEGRSEKGEFTGKVVFISPVVNPDNGTVEVRIESANPGNVLTEGMFGRLTIETNLHENTLAIPKQALVGEEGHYQVFVAKTSSTDNTSTAHKVDVVTGIADADYVEILDGSIDTETLVIIEGQNLLGEGDPIVFASPM